VAPTYPGKTVALIDERTLSQAEHAALFLRAANGTLLVGSPSAGANGDVTRFTLPGGVVVSFSGQQVLLPDGSRLQRVGLKPDVEVRPTIAGVRAGRDEVLEKALELLDAPAHAARGVAEAR
jgi:C-terminal processing protease CtpA/Prc